MAGRLGVTGSCRRALAALLLTALGLGACSGGGLTPPSLSAGSTAGDAGSSGSTADQTGGNPFQDGAAVSLAGRTVIAKPTLAEIMQPAGNLPEMSLGRPDAPVTIIKYASMTCPYCRQFQMEVFPELKRQYIDTGKVRLILREFPIGFQAGTATIALRCVAPDRYFEAYDKLMRQQSVWVSQEVRSEPILKVASQAGLTQAQFETCRQNKALIRDLDAVKQRGRTLGIVGTPNFFIGDRLIKSTLKLQDVKAIIDPMLASRS
jgi:protein-disulfide isomerase